MVTFVEAVALPPGFRAMHSYTPADTRCKPSTDSAEYPEYDLINSKAINDKVLITEARTFFIHVHPVQTKR